MTQISEAVKSKNPSLRKGLKVWGKRGLIFQKVTNLKFIIEQCGLTRPKLTYTGRQEVSSIITLI